MRHTIITTLVAFILSVFTYTANAQQSVNVDIPKKVKADILKRHPKAQDLEASNEVHFGQNLLEVTFKEEGSKIPDFELFKENGDLFTNELFLDDLNEAPTIKEALEKNFPGYELKKAALIVNPNGVGEEYEIYLTVGGVNWKVSFNQKGNIEEKYSF